MRFRVRAKDDAMYRQAVAMIGESVPVFVANAQRRFLAVGELPAILRERLGALGLEIVPDPRQARQGAPALG
jgi:hypothetical protein